METQDDFVEGEVVDVAQEEAPPITDLAVRPVGADGVTLLPVAQQQAVLAEYDARRNSFRSWLQSHLIQGVHYGYPPGCRPGRDDDQWRSKPSLYKAGALLICDLLRLKAEYYSDKDAWLQMGSVPGAFVRTCRLLTAGGERLGEGTGIFEINEKKMGPNPAIKMADKRALVASVINSVPVVGDLFTQDLEDMAPPQPNPQPAETPDRPDAPTRSQQQAQPKANPRTVFASAEYRQLTAKWKAKYQGNVEQFKQWCIDQTGGMDPNCPDSWTFDLVKQLLEVLK